MLKITMTQAVVPLSLVKVHLMVAVEGHLFQKWFHASPNLAYTFIWDKTDAYGQRVYGLSDAVGKITKRVILLTLLELCIQDWNYLFINSFYTSTAVKRVLLIGPRIYCRSAERSQLELAHHMG